jgi:predicted nucleic acid-binding protein
LAGAGDPVQAASTASHEFWPCSVSLLSEQVIDRERLLGPKQVTDIYLLALAVAHGGRFATFDQSVPLAAVHGAQPEHVSIL